MPRDHDVVTTWLPDPSHYPEQMTPLSATVWFEALGLGLHEAMRELRGPFAGFRTCTDHGWAYESQLDLEWDYEPERVREAALALSDEWKRVYRPRVWEITGELWEMRPELALPAEAAALLDRMWELVREQWTIHFLTVIPAQIAAELFHDRYVEVMGDADPLAPYRLLEDARSRDQEISKLALRARELRLDHLLRDHTPENALTRLGQLASGRLWLRDLHEYLRPDGGAGGRARWHELSLTREAEFPALTLESVRLRLEREYEPALAAREPVPDELAALFVPVAEAYRLKEEHSYHIDYPGLHATREVLLGFGRRLVAEGQIDEVDDVWMLERSELRNAVVGEDLPLRDLVTVRGAMLEAGLREGPKSFLGDPPPDAARHVALEKFYGSEMGGLSGAGASPGIGEGTARIVATVADFGRVHSGDILVATTTTPSWTPLFGSLSALVTETGGILCHAAIVAREYGIPAVVGAAGATTLIPDGARIRVDGRTGQITIL